MRPIIPEGDLATHQLVNGMGRFWRGVTSARTTDTDTAHHPTHSVEPHDPHTHYTDLTQKSRQKGRQTDRDRHRHRQRQADSDSDSHTPHSLNSSADGLSERD